MDQVRPEASTNTVVDGKYYEVAKPASIAERLLIVARDRIYSDFLTAMRPTPSCTILDVGVSDVISDGANVLERKYPQQANLTACGIGEAIEFQAEFPAIPYVRIEPNARLPFADGAFDIVTSNAVLEHVGSADNQRAFVRELSRVGKKAFITVPNRYFPVEHHTAIPLLHFGDGTFKIACSILGKQSWTEQENLILMSRSLLRRLAEGIDRSTSVGYTGLRLGPFSSNLSLSLT
ncbi:methyltransferase domain-containing protein [Rhodopseudomonas sp. NSM]|uniref:methyltransferase domain-containing protein n=1 Tax=Rhodopseudomonas sp. NSM TaxID=3457630 RepID=UPI004036BEF4